MIDHSDIERSQQTRRFKVAEWITVQCSGLGTCVAERGTCSGGKMSSDVLLVWEASD